MRGSPPNAPCQRSWVRIATPGSPMAVSAAWNPRPMVRRHAEQVEEVRRHLRAAQAPGLARIRQGRPEGPGGRDAGADVATRGPRLERPEAGGERREPILHLADADLDGDELPRIAERQRRQEHAVDDREDRCRRPDAQSEHRDHDGGESRAAAQPRATWRKSQTRPSSQRHPQTARVSSRMRARFPSLRRAARAAASPARWRPR